MAKKLSVNLFVCAAFLLLFGLVGFGAASSGPAPLDLGLAALAVGCGFYLWTGTELARLVGMGCLGLVVVVGAVSVFSGHYMPGTIVAGFGLVRLYGAAGAFGSRAGATTVPQGYGQPQYGQPQYGQPQYGQPQYGQPQYDPYAQPQYGAPAPVYGNPQFGPPPPPATPGDPRFGTPVPPQAHPAATLGDPRFGTPVPPQAPPPVHYAPPTPPG